MGATLTYYNLANDILTAVKTVFTDHAVALPARQYIAPTDVVFDFAGSDCAGQVAVQLNQIFRGKPGVPITVGLKEQCGQPSTILFYVYVVRCAPTVKENLSAPTVDELDATAEETYTDAHVLTEHFPEELMDNLTGCTDVAFGPLETADPDGAMAGWRLTVQVEL